jgi:hypothetical protein
MAQRFRIVPVVGAQSQAVALADLKTMQREPNGRRGPGRRANQGRL